jgi:hypothetical protein
MSRDVGSVIATALFIESLVVLAELIPFSN